MNPTTFMKHGAVVLFASLLNVACSPPGDSQLSTSVETSSNGPRGAIDDARINNAASEPGNWLAHGLDYREQRFSPLSQINRESVTQLGLAYELDVGSNDALEATPIMVDNTLFFTSTFSIVHAVNAATGEELWRYDPKVPATFCAKPAAVRLIEACRFTRAMSTWLPWTAD